MAAVSALGIVALWDWGRRQMVSVTLFGAVIVALTASFLFSLEGIAGTTTGNVAPGVGAYVTLVAGVLLAGSGAYGLVRRRRLRPKVAEGSDGAPTDDRRPDE